jgi:hypothetical protein
MNNKYKNIRYYRIRASVVWLTVFIIVALLLCCYYRKDIYNAWLRLGGREQISYVGLESKLDNVAECRLCGSTDDSMMDYYRKFNTLGVICVNDWNVFELETQIHDESGDDMEQHPGTRDTVGNTKEYDYETNSIPEKGIAGVNITFSNEYKPNIIRLQKKLCQGCLDKVLESFEIDRWKYEKREALPVCLVDFQTLEIYSLQEAAQKIYINDFYVKSYNQNNELLVEVIGRGIGYKKSSYDTNNIRSDGRE